MLLEIIVLIIVLKSFISGLNLRHFLKYDKAILTLPVGLLIRIMWKFITVKLSEFAYFENLENYENIHIESVQGYKLVTRLQLVTRAITGSKYRLQIPYKMNC